MTAAHRLSVEPTSRHLPTRVAGDRQLYRMDNGLGAATWRCDECGGWDLHPLRWDRSPQPELASLTLIGATPARTSGLTPDQVTIWLDLIGDPHMNDWNAQVDLPQPVTPEALLRYLTSRGWHRRGYWRGAGVWTMPHADDLLVPERIEFDDDGEVLSEAIRRVAAYEQRSELDVALDITKRPG